MWFETAGMRLLKTKDTDDLTNKIREVRWKWNTFYVVQDKSEKRGRSSINVEDAESWQQGWLNSLSFVRWPKKKQWFPSSLKMDGLVLCLGRRKELLPGSVSTIEMDFSQMGTSRNTALWKLEVLRRRYVYNRCPTKLLFVIWLVTQVVVWWTT